MPEIDEEVKLVEDKELGRIYFRPSTKGKQPSDYDCRHCGREAKKELTTEKKPEYGATYAISCCYRQFCYDYVVKKYFDI